MTPDAQGCRGSALGRGRWWAWLALGALLCGALAGCGKGEDSAEATPPGEAGGEAAPPGEGGAPPAGEPGAMPGAPPADPAMGGPGMGGESGMGGEPGMGGPGMGGMGGAPAAPAEATPVVDVKPLFPVRTNPFKPIDAPTEPKTEESRATRVVTTLPIRPGIIVPPEAPPAAPPLRPRGLRMSGFLGGATVKAILEQDKNSMVVTPGAVITIQFNGPREVKVVAISQEGVTLRDLRTQDEYFVPMEGG